MKESNYSDIEGRVEDNPTTSTERKSDGSESIDTQISSRKNIRFNYVISHE